MFLVVFKYFTTSQYLPSHRNRIPDLQTMNQGTRGSGKFITTTLASFFGFPPRKTWNSSLHRKYCSAVPNTGAIFSNKPDVKSQAPQDCRGAKLGSTIFSGEADFITVCSSMHRPASADGKWSSSGGVQPKMTFSTGVQSEAVTTAQHQSRKICFSTRIKPKLIPSGQWWLRSQFWEIWGGGNCSLG